MAHEAAIGLGHVAEHEDDVDIISVGPAVAHRRDAVPLQREPASVQSAPRIAAALDQSPNARRGDTNPEPIIQRSPGHSTAEHRDQRGSECGTVCESAHVR